MPDDDEEEWPLKPMHGGGDVIEQHWLAGIVYRDRTTPRCRERDLGLRLVLDTCRRTAGGRRAS